MMSRARVWLLMLVCGLLLAVALPAGTQAEFGIEKFVATNCEEDDCGEETIVAALRRAEADRPTAEEKEEPKAKASRRPEAVFRSA